MFCFVYYPISAPKVDGVNASLIEAYAGDVLMEEAAKDTAATQVEVPAQVQMDETVVA